MPETSSAETISSTYAQILDEFEELTDLEAQAQDLNLSLYPHEIKSELLKPIFERLKHQKGIIPYLEAKIEATNPRVRLQESVDRYQDSHRKNTNRGLTPELLTRTSALQRSLNNLSDLAFPTNIDAEAIIQQEIQETRSKINPNDKNIYYQMGLIHSGIFYQEILAALQTGEMPDDLKGHIFTTRYKCLGIPVPLTQQHQLFIGPQAEFNTFLEEGFKKESVVLYYPTKIIHEMTGTRREIIETFMKK